RASPLCSAGSSGCGPASRGASRCAPRARAGRGSRRCSRRGARPRGGRGSKPGPAGARSPPTHARSARPSHSPAPPRGGPAWTQAARSRRVARAITFYTRKQCSLCDKAYAAVERVRAALAQDEGGPPAAFDLVVVDLDSEASADKRAAYDYEVPVLELDGRKI